MPKTLWRVAPPAHLAEAVRKLAMAEGRTDCNMISRLLTEAITARRDSNHKAEQIVSAIRSVVDSKMNWAKGHSQTCHPPNI
jgi:hypothetical protein